MPLDEMGWCMGGGSCIYAGDAYCHDPGAHKEKDLRKNIKLPFKPGDRVWIVGNGWRGDTLDCQDCGGHSELKNKADEWISCRNCSGTGKVKGVVVNEGTFYPVYTERQIQQVRVYVGKVETAFIYLLNADGDIGWSKFPCFPHTTPDVFGTIEEAKAFGEAGGRSKSEDKFLKFGERL